MYKNLSDEALRSDPTWLHMYNISEIHLRTTTSDIEL